VETEVGDKGRQGRGEEGSFKSERERRRARIGKKEGDGDRLQCGWGGTVEVRGSVRGRGRA
jgi:hypothetical protein